jgi:hypothetical protein
MIPRACIDPTTGVILMVRRSQAILPLSNIAGYLVDQGGRLVVSG